MALVGYSDSEASDGEVTREPTSIPAKRLERTGDRKIKVDLPSLTGIDVDSDVIEPAVKRQRTAGAFSGFNDLLPAPKKAALKSVKPGISLRTSSEAAFSRVPAAQSSEDVAATEPLTSESAEISKSDAEPVLVGKPTRFLPLSVANAKKKKKRPVTSVAKQDTATSMAANPTAEVRDVPKVSAQKQSLFSYSAQDENTASMTASYEPEFVQSALQTTSNEQHHNDSDQIQPLDHTAVGAAADLNLSASDRRRLFGRAGDGTGVHIAHFDMNTEYQSNQDLAARGEVVEHRTVRAIAPGRHSLQQLVANVKGQTEALEDKWAEGRRARGETGNKYGW